MRIGRAIAGLLLLTKGSIYSLGAIPAVESIIRDFVESTLHLGFQPYSLRIALFGAAFLASGIGSLFHRSWALWLGVAVLLAELPFGIHATAWKLLRGVQNAGTVAAPVAPTPAHYVLACILVAATDGVIVWLLRPWTRQIERPGNISAPGKGGSVTPQSKIA